MALSETDAMHYKYNFPFKFEDKIDFVGKNIVDPGIALYKRLNDHTEFVEATTNLNLSDFRCHFLAIDYIWIPLAESMVIERFNPVWNCLLESFGNHAPSRGRSNMMTPSWDWFHPGRAWTANLQIYEIQRTA